ncbi:hypothetical protein LCGC14_2421330, partial [marine sediment metagenome]
TVGLSLLSYNTPPQIVPLNDFTQFLPASTEILFKNQTPLETGDPFTDIISWTFYFPILNLTFENKWAVVPAPADTYEFRVTAKDKLNNTAQAIYAIKASIAILGISINKFDASRPNVSLVVTISQTPLTQNFTWINLVSNTIYSTNTTSPPNTPNSTGDYTLFIYVTDSTGGSATLSKQILIDNSSMKFTLTDPINNSVHYVSKKINIKFNESIVEDYFTYHWDDNVNKSDSTNIYIPNIAGLHNLTIFCGDRAENYVIVHLSFFKHLTQSLLSPPFNNSIINPGTNISLIFSETPVLTYVHWNNNPINSTLYDTPTSSAQHTLNVTTISTLGIITTYTYQFIVRIVSSLFDVVEQQRLMNGTQIYFNFSQIPSSWKYRWDISNNASLIWFYDKKPLIPAGTGTHFLDIQVENNEGTSFNSRYSFFSDDTVPEIQTISPLTSLSPENAAIIRSGTSLKVTVTDSQCSITSTCLDNIKYSYNNQSNQTIDLTSINTSLPYNAILPTVIPAPILGEITNVTIYLYDSVG